LSYASGVRVPGPRLWAPGEKSRHYWYPMGACQAVFDQKTAPRIRPGPDLADPHRTDLSTAPL